MLNNNKIIILGGGPAGLAAGYYAQKKKLPFTIYEASDHIGGNSITYKHGDFYFDSGAHRFHDKIPEITNEVKNLLGSDLQEINAPSKIYANGCFIDFPLTPLNLLKNLGIKTCIKAGIEIIVNKLSTKAIELNFERVVLRTYGKTIATLFLLNYSNKLWGSDCANLSYHVSGSRLKGLDIKTFFLELFGNSTAKTRHLDGRFLYPSFGIGQIMDKLRDFCGSENITTSTPVTKIFHDGTKVISVMCKNKIAVTHIINTLPLNVFICCLEPLPPKEVLEVAGLLRFRAVILMVLFINQEKISENASFYFPDKNLPFTRIYEPKNRSARMSPPGKTSLVVEVPCFESDAIWDEDKEKLYEKIMTCLLRINLLKKEDVIDYAVYKVKNAYPVVETETENHLHKINTYLSGFTNLKIVGRGAQFSYNHIHDLMYNAKQIIEQC